MSALVLQLATLAFAATGVSFVVGARRWAARLGAVAVILAVGAGLAARLAMGV